MEVLKEGHDYKKNVGLQCLWVAEALEGHDAWRNDCLNQPNKEDAKKLVKGLKMMKSKHDLSGGLNERMTELMTECKGEMNKRTNEWMNWRNHE